MLPDPHVTLQPINAAAEVPTVPPHAAERIKPLLNLRGSLWVGATGPYVLKIRVKTPTIALVELRLIEAKGKKRATWKWDLGSGELRRGYYYADADLAQLYKLGEDSRETMFSETLKRHLGVIQTAFARVATSDQPLANSPWCAVCGRAFTDPNSRARGIGPECIKKFGDRANDATTAQIVQSKHGVQP